MKKIRVAAVSAALAVASIGLTATTAQAAHNCHAPYLCLYYNSNQQGAWMTSGSDIPDFAGYQFNNFGTTSAGFGQNVKNNAASASHGGITAQTARVYYNSNYSGVYDDVVPNSSRNLVNTYNENASLHFFW